MTVLDDENDVVEPDLEEDGGDGPHVPLDWNISVDRDQKSVFEMHRRFERKELVLNPGFQRDDVWPQSNKVRLIESVLLRLPLPAIYVAQEDSPSGEYDVVIDGRQRLSALFGYLRDEFPLKGLQLLPEKQFEGKFSKLDKRFQRRIEDFPLSVMVLRRGTDPDVKFHLFERLNRGGVSLNAQEIRNGLFRGPGLELVRRLASVGGDFRRVAGEHRNWHRMLAEQLALRVLAFLVAPKPAPYGGGMEVFLNRALRWLNDENGAVELAALEAKTAAALRAVLVVFGPDAFCRVDTAGRRGKHLNAALMDAICSAFALRARSDVDWLEAAPALRASLEALWGEPQFQDSLTLGTSDVRRVSYRLERWLMEVDRVAPVHA